MVDFFHPDFSINKNLFIEASAGTGKTYTLENLFIRRLLEPVSGSYIEKEQIAVVTFTRACATELKWRISQRLDSAIEWLDTDGREAPAYLQKMSKTAELALFAKEKLKGVKTNLYASFIGTIHSFAASLLLEFYHGSCPLQWLTMQEIEEEIKNHFLTTSDPGEVANLALLFRHFEKDSALIIQKLAQNLFQKEESENLLTLFQKFKVAVEASKLSEKEVFSALQEASGSFCNICTREGAIKDELQKQFSKFSGLFSPSASFDEWVEFLHDPFLPSRVFAKPKAKEQDPYTNIGGFIAQFEPIIQKAASVDFLISCTASLLVNKLQPQWKKEGKMSERLVLSYMKEALQDKAFVQFLHGRFRAVFIDEFQDTDPLQSDLFFTTFMKSDWNGFLYIVGDPKQSIYAFRQADVYNYMKVKELFRDDERAFLVKNWRSTQSLIQAINSLFAGDIGKLVFWLPKRQEAISCVSLEAASSILPIPDGKKAICFFCAQSNVSGKRSFPDEETEKKFFSYIAKEIISLKVPLEKMAVLLKDRFVAERLSLFLKKESIPTAFLRKESVATTQGFVFLNNLFNCLERPQDRTRLFCLVAQPPFSFSFAEQVELQQDLPVQGQWVEQLLHLKDAFLNKGVSGFANECLEWLQKQYTAHFYIALEQLFDLLINQERVAKSLVIDDARKLLQTLERRSADDDEALVLRREPHQDAVTLVTGHKSKGLEFDVVFALGAAYRTPPNDDAKEADAEKLRQFYVMCTRAKRRLYLPVIFSDEPGWKKPNQGCASPIELYLASRYIHATQKDPAAIIGQRDLVYDYMAPQFIKEALDATVSHPCMMQEEAEKREVMPHYTPQQKESEPFAKARAKVKVTPFFVSSFSKLQAHHEPLALSSDLLFPQGKQVGLLFHELLATLDHPESCTLEWLTKNLKGSCLQGYEERVFQLFSKLFAATFSSPYGQFCLRDIDWKSSFREVEFFHSTSQDSLRGCCAIRGVIDFAFCHEGLSYIIDWKSHYLEDYSHAGLRQALHDGDYAKQAHIYGSAWQTHLERQGKEKSDFKGLFFVFLRGVAQEKGLVWVDAKELQHG